MALTIAQQAHAHYDAGSPYEIPIPNTSLFELLDDAARLYPDNVAIDYFGAAITYRRIHRQSLQAAQVLYEAGVRKGDVVAISLPNCPQAFVVFYACMRLGAVAAQHNPLAPRVEVAGQLSRHGARVAVVWEKSVEAFPVGGDSSIRTVFTVDISAQMPLKNRVLLRLPVAKARQTREQLRGMIPSYARSWDRAVSAAKPVSEDVEHAVGSDRAAILHTGGTNGVPKSVPLTHTNIGANVNQNIFWVWKLHEGAETFFSLLPYFHAFGMTFFLCCAVRKAATQVVLPKFDADMSLEAHRRRPVTFFVGVPPMFDRVLNRAIETGTSLSSIKWAVSGAMPLSTAVAARWEEYTGGGIVEGYGLSETSPVVSGSPLAPGHRHGVLGLPFASTQIRLVDLEDPSVDVVDGEPGEILVKGPQVFEGYLDAPEENAAVFVDGWFRTGDVAVNEGGYLVMSDRKKELILSGGFNVYPSQVESAIRSMPQVADVAVVGVPVADAREEVVAAVVVSEGSVPPSLDEVRAWTQNTLPRYALPRRVEVISELPRNQIGKVQRRVVRERLMDPDSTS